MKVYYRFSFNNMLGSDGKPRPNPGRPEWFDKWQCLKNFTTVFAEQDITIVADGVADDVWEQLTTQYPTLDLQRTKFGHNAGSFLYSLEQAVNLPDETLVYFVEDDYVHHEGADLILEQGLMISPYATLYDHPNKYWDPEVKKPCLLLKSETCHWRTTPSTTMTFGARVGFLKADKVEFYRWCNGDDNWTHDTQLFEKISSTRGLISPVPGYSTHCDQWVVDSLIDWQDVLTRTTE